MAASTDSRGWATLLGTLSVVLSLAGPPICLAQQAGGERIRQQDMFTSANVLAPGTHDDWPLATRDGETIIISVSSRSLDPTVELVGPDGQVIARNDDVRPGQKDSLLLARLDVAGDYKVRVASSNAASGGRYELIVQRFIATDLPIGSRTTSTLGKTLAHWHRFRAEADRTLVLSARAASFQAQIQIYAPNGERVQAGAGVAGQQDSTRAVFRATQTGMYYARISSPQGGDSRESYAITAATARVFQTVIGEPNPERRIEPGGLDLWTFRGNPGDLIRVQARTLSGEMIAHLSFVPPTDASGKPQGPEGPVPPLVILPSDPKSSGVFVALLNIPGTYQVAVWHPLGVGVDYTFVTSRPGKPLAKDVESSGMLGLGGTEFWTIEGIAGEVVRFACSSEQFDTDLELYGPQGDLVNKDDDGGGGRNSLLTGLLIERGRYILRVHAHGDGGGGLYKLRRVSDSVRTLAIGGRGEGTLGAGGSEVWSFEGHAGQTVILSARSPDFNIRIALIGPDATEIASDDDGGEGTDSLLSARLPIDGAFTIWITSTAGGGRYSLQLIESR
jgi:hypothetical protein